MRHNIILLFFIIQTFYLSSISLKQIYDEAQPFDIYDRYLELENGIIYEGGLFIGSFYHPQRQSFINVTEENVKIVGNGAILDLQGQQICISYCNKQLDIEDCVIINGNIRFRGDNTLDFDATPTGSVRYVTFYQPHDYAIRLQGAGTGITIERNIAVDVVDTDVDFNPYNGVSSLLLPTGTSFSGSVQIQDYGFPFIHDNWSYHSKPSENNDPLTHFSLLCEFG